MLGIALGLTSSLCWGVADFMGGLQSRKLALLWVIEVSQGVGLVGLAALLVLRGHGSPTLVHLLPAVGGGVLGIAGLGAFYRGLAIGTMSVVAPIAATSVVIPVVVGVAGGDRPSVAQVLGIVTASIGVVLVSRETEEDVGGERYRATRLAVLLALIASVGFGTFFVGVRASARYDVLWTLFAARAAAVITLGMAIAVTRPAPPRAVRPYALLASVGALDASANGLYALATRHGLLSIVAVASALYPLATVLLARTLLHERVRRIQEVGIAAALTGVVLMAAG